MCGINGFLNAPEFDFGAMNNLVGQMNARLAHRGPDDEGIWALEPGHKMTVKANGSLRLEQYRDVELEQVSNRLPPNDWTFTEKKVGVRHVAERKNNQRFWQ